MFEIGKLPSLDLGYQGENKVRTIDIDMTAWLEEYPGSKVALMVKRPDEDTYYPAGKMEGNVLLWVIDRADRQYAGRGEAQIILTNKDDVELRSRIVKTKISPSLTGTEVEAPPPQQTWVGEVLQAAQKAEEAVGHMPVIGENGNWYAWDADKDAYEDTGRPSKGKDGEDGYTPQKGKDYFDGKDGISPVVEVTPITGGHRVTITDANGRKTFDVMDGEGGGGSGNDGEDGGYYIPAVVDAILSWTPSKSGMPAVPSADIKGPKGDEGYTPVKGKDYFDGTSVTVSSVSESTADGGTNVVTFSDGKKLNVRNGSKGKDGVDGRTPVAGVDYFTEADKAELVEEVKSQIGEVDGDYAPAIHADQHGWNDTLTWDGDETGRTTAVIYAYNGEEDKVVLLSEKVPTTADLANGYFIAAYNAETGRHENNEHSLDDVGVNSDGAMMLPDGGSIFIIPTDNYVYKEFHVSFTFPKAGVYWMYYVYDGVVSNHIEGFTIPGYNFIESTDPITPERIGAAPSYHASESAEHGVGTDKKYGHLKVADVEEVFTGGEENLFDIAIELPTGDPFIDLKPYAFGAVTGWIVSNLIWDSINETDTFVVALDELVNNLRLEVIKLRNEVDALKGGS